MEDLVISEIRIHINLTKSNSDFLKISQNIWQNKNCLSCQSMSIYALDIDDCAPSPCQNGGTCTDGVDSYNCICVAGINGTNCEISEFCVEKMCLK